MSVFVFVDVVGALVNRCRRRVIAQDAIGPRLIGCPRQHHKAQAWRQIVGVAEDPIGPGDQRVVALQRNENRVGALGYQIEAVIEKLAEEREPGVEGSGKTGVRRNVRYEEHGTVVGRAKDPVQSGAHDAGGAWRRARRRHGRRVVAGLIGNQIGNDAGLRVEHEAAGLRVRCGRGPSGPRAKEVGRLYFRRAKLRLQQTREGIVGGPELLLALHQIVELATDRPEPPRDLHVG